jgi:hypothetical protein
MLEEKKVLVESEKQVEEEENALFGGPGRCQTLLDILEFGRIDPPRPRRGQTGEDLVLGFHMFGGILLQVWL